MEKKQLAKGFRIFGNKGNVWSKECHIIEENSFSGKTLCGVPMLSTNWARIEGVEEVGCKECISLYQHLQLQAEAARSEHDHYLENGE